MIISVVVACTAALLNGSQPDTFLASSVADAANVFQQMVVKHPEVYPAGKCSYTAVDVTSQRAQDAQQIKALDDKLQSGGSANATDIQATLKSLVHILRYQLN